MYKLISKKRNRSEKFGLEKLSLRIKLNKIRKDTCHDFMTSIFDDLLKKYIFKIPAYKIGLIISMLNLDPELCIEFRPPEDISGYMISERLSKIFQSNREINLEYIKIEATYFKLSRKNRRKNKGRKKALV